MESVMQRESEQDGDVIPLVLLTHEVKEKQINLAISKIESLPTTCQKVVRIRVEHLN
ncbi:MAG: homoserine dehydrogenase [Oleiphilaceae bacterium]